MISPASANRPWASPPFARSRLPPPPAAITRERAGVISGLDGIHQAMDSVAKKTTDRGIIAVLIYAAVMARPGDEVAAGDGFGAFCAVAPCLALMPACQRWSGSERDSTREPSQIMSCGRASLWWQGCVICVGGPGG
jgi:hypothetical protein